MKKREFLGMLFATPTLIATQATASEKGNSSMNDFYIDPAVYGMSTESPDNSDALQKAIDLSVQNGLPVAIRSSNDPYLIKSNIQLKGIGGALIGIGGNAHLKFDGAGLIISEEGGKNRGQIVRDLMLSRIGEPGPVIHMKTTRKAKSSRFTWNNIHILSSTGDGVVFEGAYLGAVSGLWVTRCGGTGIVFKPGSSDDSNAAGANSISFMGGESQNCGWGIEATDTKGITFNGFAVEGNRLGGIWLHGDNRVFTLTGGYFENNAKKLDGAQKKMHHNCDIRIGDPEWSGPGNRNISINNAFFSDGKVQHRNAVWIENNQHNIVFNMPFFWAYGSSPILFADSKRNNSSGQVISGENSRTDGRQVNILKHDLSSW